MTDVARVELYRDTAGEHRWRAVASNGEIVADSGEGYVRLVDCEDEARRLFDGVKILLIPRPDGDEG